MPLRPAILTAAALLLAGCATCDRPADMHMGVGVGTSGTAGHMSVGQGCGPLQFRVGTGWLG